MAKINRNNFIDTCNDYLGAAKKRGVIQLEFEGDDWKGDTVQIDNKKLANFGTCGYMGIESHPDVIAESINFAKRYGVQFSVSRTFLVSKQNYLLEEYLSTIFKNKPIITFTSTTMAHASILPIVVGFNDVIILDQQVHATIQTAAQLMIPKGVPIELVKHNDINMLEEKIEKLRDKYEKIWFMVDGVYSMYGDVAPMDEINQLMEKYSNLYLYMDDAHGMSWHGEHGCGKLFDKTLNTNRVMYVTTMAKGYGTMGGIGVFPTSEWYDKIILYGGMLAHSHPIPPPMMGAAIASAKLHLSPEIYSLQNSLKEKLDYANSLLNDSNLPVVSHPDTPIYFIGTGQPHVGYNLNKRLIDEGFYVNMAVFPTVPVKKTGLRFTITNHNSKDQIKAFIDAICYHYPKVMEEENKTINEIKDVFHLNHANDETKKKKINQTKLQINTANSISDISKDNWDSVFKDKTNFDWDSLLMMEKGFSENNFKEENWKFYYITILNQKEELVLATFFTSGVFKDDLLSSSEVSREIENRRGKDKYYLCSNTLCMGSLITEGDHLFVDKTSPEWELAIDTMLDYITEIRNENDIENIILRDFKSNEDVLEERFHQNGFIKVNMPNSNVIFGLEDKTENNFIQSLSSRSRRHIRNDVLKYSEAFEIEIVNNMTELELQEAYDLYRNASEKSTAVNMFNYPFKVFQLMNESKDWEFIKIFLKKEVVAVGFCFKSKSNYFPLLVGFDYEANTSNNVYKQMLYQVVLQAINLKKKVIYFGYTADIEKKKLGATQVQKNAFMEINDDLNFEIINNITT